MKKKILLTILTVALVFGMTICVGIKIGIKDSSNDGSLNGTWTKTSTGYKLIIYGDSFTLFNPDNSVFAFNAVSYRNGSMTIGNNQDSGRYGLSGIMLTLSMFKTTVYNGRWTR